jgi:tRNA(Ile)-lysidine synthase
VSADNAARLKESVKWFLLSEELVPRDELVLAAVSGGADSMAMFSVLHRVSKEIGFRLAAAFFDHQIRESGEEEKSRVAALAREFSVPFYSGEADVRAEAAASGDSLEEAARKARYRFLYGVADQIHAGRIATGHTRDDQVETVLMRILRGSGIRGLTGIPVRRGRVIRPMLAVRRSDTVAYCHENKLNYIEDPTNEERRFFRNRVRRDLLPVLRSEYNEAVDDNLLRLATNANEVIGSVRAKIRPLIDQNLRESATGEWIVNVAPLSALDDMAVVIFFGDLLAGPVGCDLDFTRKHYRAIVQLVRDVRGSGKQLHLPGVKLRKEYENVIITRPKAGAQALPRIEYRAALTVPGETSAAGVVVRTEIVDGAAVPDPKATSRAAYFALDHLKLPLVLRCPGVGDRMRPFGMQGSKKLSDIFTDCKIPGRERSRALVVTDAEEILWLVGVATSEKSRVGRDTGKVVRITIDQELAST